MPVAVLFPHTQISISNLEKVLSCFERVTIFQPWFMEQTFPQADKIDPASIRIAHPREALKPPADIRNVLKEYKTWLSENPDRGYSVSLQADLNHSSSESTLWGIRRLISRFGEKEDADPRKEQTLRWHMILHLAREFEENRMEAEGLLNKLRNRKSPLQGALDEDPPGFFEDTPLMETRLRVDAYDVRRVLEAWFGLFGESLKKDEPLVTFDPMVMEYAADLFELKKEGLSDAEEGNSNLLFRAGDGQFGYPMMCFPKPGTGVAPSNDIVIKGLSEKTIILMQEQRL